MTLLRGFAKKLGVLEFLGTWNANTNTPALASGVGQRNGYYIVSVSGNTNLDGVIDWESGDWAIFNGTVWEKIDNSELVKSVAGRTGEIVLTSNDITDFNTTVNDRLSSEESTRTSADTSLTSRVSSEESTRTSADTSLTTRLSSEESTRTSADTSLTSRVSSEESTRTSADTSLTTRLSSEESTRTAEDLTFLKLDGSRSMTGSLDMGTNNISNVTDVSLTNKLTSKKQVTTPTYTSAISNGTLNLNQNSSTVHFITETAPTANYSVVLPNATTLENGTNFEIYNRTSGTIFIKYTDGSSAGTLSKEAVSSLILQSNATSNGVWSPFTAEIAQQAAGIISYTLEQTAVFTTASATDVQVTSFIIVPQAGQYFIGINATVTCSGNNATNYITIYKNNIAQTGTERSSLSSGNNTSFILSTQGVVAVNGTDEIRVYVRTVPASGAAPTLNVNNRSIIALRLGTGV